MEQPNEPRYFGHSFQDKLWDACECRKGPENRQISTAQKPSFSRHPPIANTVWAKGEDRSKFRIAGQPTATDFFRSLSELAITCKSRMLIMVDVDRSTGEFDTRVLKQAEVLPKLVPAL